MTKQFTLLFIVGLSLAGQAQDLQKGSALLGGSVSFTSSKQSQASVEDRKINALNLNPSAGKFYRSNRLVGLNLFYSHASNSASAYNLDSYGAGLFLRQYLPIGKSFYVFAEEGGLAAAETIKQTLSSAARQNEKLFVAELYFFPGLAFAINRHFQAELGLTQLVNLFYTHSRLSETDQLATTLTKSNSVYLQAGAPNVWLGQLAFGMKWLLD